MTLVVDASAGVAALTDAGEAGSRIRERFHDQFLCAPSVFSFEVASTIRRQVLRGDIPAEFAEIAHAHLLSLPIVEVPYSLLAQRAWELRENVTITDGAYVALAEVLDAELVTLDRRLADAPGIRCRVFVA